MAVCLVLSTISPDIQLDIINMTVTFALASLAASASAAMALWSWTGSLTSLLQHGYSRLVISNYGDRVQAGRLRGAPDSRYGVLQYTRKTNHSRGPSSLRPLQHVSKAKKLCLELPLVSLVPSNAQCQMPFLHFHSLDLHTPRVGGVVKGVLHPLGDLLPSTKHRGYCRLENMNIFYRN